MDAIKTIEAANAVDWVTVIAEAIRLHAIAVDEVYAVRKTVTVSTGSAKEAASVKKSLERPQRIQMPSPATRLPRGHPRQAERAHCLAERHLDHLSPVGTDLSKTSVAS